VSAASRFLKFDSCYFNLNLHNFPHFCRVAPAETLKKKRSKKKKEKVALQNGVASVAIGCFVRVAVAATREKNYILLPECGRDPVAHGNSAEAPSPLRARLQRYNTNTANSRMS